MGIGIMPGIGIIPGAGIMPVRGGERELAGAGQRGPAPPARARARARGRVWAPPRAPAARAPRPPAPWPPQGRAIGPNGVPLTPHGRPGPGHEGRGRHAAGGRGVGRVSVRAVLLLHLGLLLEGLHPGRVGLGGRAAGVGAGHWRGGVLASVRAPGSPRIRLGQLLSAAAARARDVSVRRGGIRGRVPAKSRLFRGRDASSAPEQPPRQWGRPGARRRKYGRAARARAGGAGRRTG
jgi:hypothetical protein